MRNIKMRRIFTIAITAIAIALIGACGNATNGANNQNAEKDKSDKGVLLNNMENNKVGNENSKTLVIYSSFIGEQYSVGVIEKGNTEIVADMIIEKLGADRFKVEPKNDIYPKDSYKKLTEIASKELHDNARPEILDFNLDLSKYDTIFIGAPVWWGDFPMIMYTLFEKIDLNGKTIVPFSTHGGSGLSGFDSKLRRIYPNANVTKGLAITGTNAQNKKDNVKKEVESFIDSLNLTN